MKVGVVFVWEKVAAAGGTHEEHVDPREGRSQEGAWCTGGGGRWENQEAVMGWRAGELWSGGVVSSGYDCRQMNSRGAPAWLCSFQGHRGPAGERGQWRCWVGGHAVAGEVLATVSADHCGAPLTDSVTQVESGEIHCFFSPRQGPLKCIPGNDRESGETMTWSEQDAGIHRSRASFVSVSSAFLPSLKLVLVAFIFTKFFLFLLSLILVF